MGSRITRTVFRNQINRPIDQTRGKQIFQAATFFLAFLSILAFFLYGYLYRPYLPLNQYLVLTLIVGFFLIQKQKVSAPLAILTGFALIIVFVVAKIIGFDMMAVKGALILATTLFASDSQQGLMPSHIGKQSLLWLQWEFFAIGLTLSHTVQQHFESQTQVTQETEVAQLKEDQVGVRIVFCILAFMGVYLAVAGIKYLAKSKKKGENSEPKQQQIDWIRLLLTGVMLVSAFAFEHSAALTINQKLVAVFIPVLIKIAFQFMGRPQYTSLVVYLLATVSFSLQFLTENDESVEQMLQLVKLIAVNLLVLDSLGMWNRNSPSQNGQHSPILPVWFITFCFCWLWDLGSYFYNIHPFIVQLVSFSVYGVLLFFHGSKKYSAYEALP